MWSLLKSTTKIEPISEKNLVLDSVEHQRIKLNFRIIQLHHFTLNKYHSRDFYKLFTNFWEHLVHLYNLNQNFCVMINNDLFSQNLC